MPTMPRHQAHALLRQRPRTFISVIFLRHASVGIVRLPAAVSFSTYHYGQIGGFSACIFRGQAGRRQMAENTGIVDDTRI